MKPHNFSSGFLPYSAPVVEPTPALRDITAQEWDSHTSYLSSLKLVVDRLNNKINQDVKSIKKRLFINGGSDLLPGSLLYSVMTDLLPLSSISSPYAFLTLSNKGYTEAKMSMLESWIERRPALDNISELSLHSEPVIGLHQKIETFFQELRIREERQIFGKINELREIRKSLRGIKNVVNALISKITHFTHTGLYQLEPLIRSGLHYLVNIFTIENLNGLPGFKPNRNSLKFSQCQKYLSPELYLISKR